jgi:hypothetical protein
MATIALPWSLRSAQIPQACVGGFQVPRVPTTLLLDRQSAHSVDVTASGASTSHAGLVDVVVATLGESAAEILVTHGVREGQRGTAPSTSRAWLLQALGAAADHASLSRGVSAFLCSTVLRPSMLTLL